ncbi:MAG: nuclear transport factor 2 family protein [Chitinophagaceae bacterium]
MKSIFLLTALIAFSCTAHSQTTEDSVKAAVKLLFDGMINSDPAKIQSAFADSAILQTIGRVKEGSETIKNESVKEFVASISKLPKGAADERISFETIKIDGPLAAVWTPYKFYYKGQFSHCGVDSYQLVRINGVWKIQYLIDTRRKQPCE